MYLYTRDTVVWDALTLLFPDRPILQQSHNPQPVYFVGCRVFCVCFVLLPALRFFVEGFEEGWARPALS